MRGSRKRNKGTSRRTYLKREEMIGILASILLSIMMAAIAVLAIVYGGPLLFEWCSSGLYKIVQFGMNLKSKSLPYRPQLSVRALRKAITENIPILTKSKLPTDVRSDIMMLLNNSYDETRVGLYQMEEIMTLFEDGIREDVSVETCRDSTLEMNDYKTLAFPTLRHAVETMSSQDRLRYDPVLILDRFAIREMSDVLDLLQAHIVFPNIREDNNNNEETLFGEDFYLSISSQYRGVPFGNRHGRAYTDLLSGRVKWFLFRPHQLPKHGFDPFESIYEWVYKVYPKLPTAEKPIEFIQEPGQMLIIPEGYYYAYINLAEERSVAIMQVSEEFNLAGKLYYVSEALKRAALAETSEALAFLQMAAHLGGDPWLNYLMGRMHHSVGNLEEAEDQFKRAVAGNLRDPRAYEALISLWQDRRPAEGIEEYPDKDSHTVDALKIALSAGISLRNNFLKKMLSIHDIEMADAPA